MKVKIPRYAESSQIVYENLDIETENENEDEEKLEVSLSEDLEGTSEDLEDNSVFDTVVAHLSSIESHKISRTVGTTIHRKGKLCYLLKYELEPSSISVEVLNKPVLLN